mmetsp:Transcript_26177/g.83106  ORF Transcript_26177/g.83106 Transcript_26177/m.83106 type:complete len:275 (-) Transcript_26177:1186-2010(-)
MLRMSRYSSSSMMTSSAASLPDLASSLCLASARSATMRACATSSSACTAFMDRRSSCKPGAVSLILRVSSVSLSCSSRPSLRVTKSWKARSRFAGTSTGRVTGSSSSEGTGEESLIPPGEGERPAGPSSEARRSSCDSMLSLLSSTLLSPAPLGRSMLAGLASRGASPRAKPYSASTSPTAPPSARLPDKPAAELPRLAFRPPLEPKSKTLRSFSSARDSALRTRILNWRNTSCTCLTLSTLTRAASSSSPGAASTNLAHCCEIKWHSSGLSSS